MLVTFVIDAESLDPELHWTPSQARSYHLTLLDLWRRAGLLVYDGAAFESSRIKARIDSLPPKLLPLWQELLERVPVTPGAATWTGVAENNSLCLDALRDCAKVAIVDDAKAEAEFGIEETELSKCCPSHPSVEICRVSAAQHANAFSQAAALSVTHILSGETYQEIWARRFSTLARAPVKHVAIVDRYAISQHFECPQGRLSGLERFLRLLDTDAAGKRYVTVYSAWTAELQGRTSEDVELEMREVFRRLPAHNVKKITTLMLPNADFSHLAHDRFVRFGEYVWDIGLGVRVFEGPAAEATSEASFKCCLIATTYKPVEDSLAARPSAKRIDVP